LKWKPVCGFDIHAKYQKLPLLIITKAYFFQQRIQIISIKIITFVKNIQPSVMNLKELEINFRRLLNLGFD
jgi:hypothetical protein